MEKTTKKRIEYVDALRGFAMYLVVYSHIWTFGYHADSSNSFDHILLNFFLVLFFFVSGFVAYKKEQDWNMNSINHKLKEKAIQLLIPSIVFTALFYGTVYHNLAGIQHIALAEYWFTVQLFFFFVFYYFTMFFCKKMSGTKLNVALLSVAFLIFILSYSHVIIEKTQIGANLFHYLGIKYWRYYLFFCIGIVIRNSFEQFKRITDNPCYMAFFVIGFFFMIFFADQIEFPMWKPIRMIVYGLLSIIVIFTFFRKHESSFQSKTKVGYVMQYIGKRTLDIYMIHYFVLPLNLNAWGNYFVNNINHILEFFTTSIIVLLVLTVSIVIGNIIRLSPLLSHYLFGSKKKLGGKDNIKEEICRNS